MRPFVTYSTARILILLLSFINCLLCDPKVFKFRDRQDTQYFGKEITNSVRQFDSANDADYFRLLHTSAGHLIIGAADTIYNISIETFMNVSVYNWTPGSSQYNDCIMKSVDQHACHNYIRIFSKSSDGNFIICGTNAYRPQCRVLEHGMGKIVSEFSGTGLSPLDPRQNTTVHMDGQLLYAATVADFAGTDSLIFRRNISEPGNDRGLRTQRNNDMLLNKPQFVGEIHTNEHVYFFFREEANEADTISTYSRVARVCKSDRGGPRNYYEAEWTSFVKARLNCSIPEKNRPFYFDEIISITKLLTTADGRKIFYATFVSEFNFLRHSVICAFELAAIEKLFAESDILVLDSDRAKRRWTHKRREDKISNFVGQCQSDSRKISEDDTIQLRKYSLLADSAANIFSRGAVGIHRGSDHYNQIAVLQNVEFHEGTADVLYVATDQGNVIKMVNLAAFSASFKGKISGLESSHNSSVSREDDGDPLIPVAIFDVSKLPIRSLLIPDGKYLVVVTDLAVHRFPLHICASYSTCRSCVESRDPHCVWHNFECTHMKKVQKRYVYQDVIARRADICREIAAQEGKEFRNTENPLLAPLQIDISSNVRHSANYTSYYRSRTNEKCECEKNKLLEDKKKDDDCLCPTNNNQQLFLGRELGTFSRRQVPSETLPINATFFDHFQSVFPAIRSVNVSATPWWVLLIIGFAMAQTVGFLYLCCKLYTSRRKRRKFSSTSSMVAVAENATKSAPAQNSRASTFTKYTLYPSPTTSSTVYSANYASSPSDVISAYSPHSLLSGSTINVTTKHSNTNTKCNQNYSTQNLNYNNYHNGMSATNNYDKFSKLHPLYGIRRGAISFVDGSCYRVVDENAAALATATFSRTPSTVDRMNSFCSAEPHYRNASTLDSRASGRQKISQNATFSRCLTDDNTFDRSRRTYARNEPPTSATLSTSSEDSATMSSASTNVTHLSSFYSESDIIEGQKTIPPKNYISSTKNMHNDAPNAINNDEEDISIQLEGSTSTASQNFDNSGVAQFIDVNHCHGLALNFSQNNGDIQQCANLCPLQGREKPLAHLQRTSTGVIIRA